MWKPASSFNENTNVSDGDGNDDDDIIGNDGVCDKKWWHDSMADGLSHVDGPECMISSTPPVVLCTVQPLARMNNTTWHCIGCIGPLLLLSIWTADQITWQYPCPTQNVCIMPSCCLVNTALSKNIVLQYSENVAPPSWFNTAGPAVQCRVA